MPGSLYACRSAVREAAQRAADGPERASVESRALKLGFEGEAAGVLGDTQFLSRRREGREMDGGHVRDELDEPRAHALHVLQQIRFVPSHLQHLISKPTF